MGNTLIINTATLADLPDIIRLENSEWDIGHRCSSDNFLKRLENYQQGFLVGKVDNSVVASFYAIRRTYNPDELINWDKDSGYGTGDTHDINGNSLFSISITVSRNAPIGTYRKMMDAWQRLANQQKINYIYAGSRLPGLSHFNGKPEIYLSMVKSGKLFDPILSKAQSYGFCIGDLIPNYFYDQDSLHYGAQIFKIL